MASLNDFVAFWNVFMNGLYVVLPNRHEVPIRCMLDRDEDMIITGGRHPYLAKYKV